MLSCLLAFTLLLHLSHSLLEDAFVTFNQTTGAVPIHGATVIHSYDESPGVRIAVASLLDDFEAITGNRPPSWQYRSNDSSTPQGHAIVVSTLDSELMRQVRDRTNVDLSMLEGKREAFLTMLISDALPGLETALLIAGSDSRAATFGVHTLAEQAGQSP